MQNSKFIRLVFLLISVILTACQSQPVGHKLIAGVFNSSTHIQQKFIDLHAPQHVLSHHNILYSTQPQLTLDLYQPENIEQLGIRPTIVWIHGGGWIAGSKEHARGYFKRLAAQGYNVAAIQYQFAPSAQYPQQLLQINQALDYLIRNAAQYHLADQHFYLAGDSAGANLASHYAALVSNQDFAQQSNIFPNLKLQQLKGLILHCGIYDLAQFVQQAPQEIKIIEWGIYQLIEAYLGKEKHNEQFLRAISPQSHLNSDYPPVLISSGNKDFLTQSQAYPFVTALKQHEIPVTAIFYPDSKELLVHEYQFMMSKKASQNTFLKTIDFLKNYSIALENYNIAKF